MWLLLCWRNWTKRKSQRFSNREKSSSCTKTCTRARHGKGSMKEMEWGQVENGWSPLCYNSSDWLYSQCKGFAWFRMQHLHPHQFLFCMKAPTPAHIDHPSGPLHVQQWWSEWENRHGCSIPSWCGRNWLKCMGVQSMKAEGLQCDSWNPLTKGQQHNHIAQETIFTI